MELETIWRPLALHLLALFADYTLVSYGIWQRGWHIDLDRVVTLL